MALEITDNTLRNFVKLTGVDVMAYMQRWDSFSITHYPLIVGYFNGTYPTLDQTAIQTFNTLKADASNLSDILVNKSKNFNRMDDWNLIDFIDEIYSLIFQIDDIDRFLRSAKTDAFNLGTIAGSYTATDADTPERIAGLDRIDPQNEWTDIFIKNNIRETDYRAEEGGYTLNIGRQTIASAQLQSIVDNLFGERVYGLDIDREFRYSNNDLLILTYRPTALQSIEVLGFLKKGDVPEFPGLGISPDLAVGGTLGLIATPFITREMAETFQSDDSLLNFRITNVTNKGASLFVEYEVETFYNFIVQQSTFV